MCDVDAWVADQRDRNRQDFHRFLEQQRHKWMPRHVFNRCCVKWLADGNFSHHDEFHDEYSFRNGCQGNCGREHPLIVLDFHVERKVTTATLSHPELAPFQGCFQEYVNQETAWVRDRTSYELSGFIRENQTKLRAQSYFGSHLVTIANGALEASDAAQREQLEERPAKRPKTYSAADAIVLEKAMTVVLQEKSSWEEMDLFSLCCMRQVSRFFRDTAMQVATNRLKASKFYIIPLTDGMAKRGDNVLVGDDESWEITDGYELSAVQYHRCDNVLFESTTSVEASNEEERLGEASFVPSDADSAEFKWDSGFLYDGADEYYGYKKSTEDYCGQKLRVFWRPQAVDGVEEKPRTDVYDTPLPSLGIDLANFNIGEDPKAGVNVVSCRTGVTAEFEVLESLEETGVGLDEDEPDEECTRYSGRVRIVKLKVDFGALVRQHALQLYRNMRREHARIERERPLKASELAHMQLIEAAAK